MEIDTKRAPSADGGGLPPDNSSARAALGNSYPAPSSITSALVPDDRWRAAVGYEILFCRVDGNASLGSMSPDGDVR
jgi:hypothetical protein